LPDVDATSGFLTPLSVEEERDDAVASTKERSDELDNESGKAFLFDNAAQDARFRLRELRRNPLARFYARLVEVFADRVFRVGSLLRRQAFAGRDFART
jgi:hypothetical protein